MRRTRADQGFEAERPMQSVAQPHEAHAELVGRRIRHAGRGVRLTHLAEDRQQRAALVAERPELDPPPESFTAGIQEKGQRAGGLAGEHLRRRHEAGGHVGRLSCHGRAMRGTGEPHDRLGRLPRQRFPGPVHPAHAQRRVEPEHWLARLLPDLVRLERRSAWRRHEKWFNLS